MVLVRDVTREAAILDAATDAVGTTRQDEFGQFMATRWPGLVRLAYGLTGDRWLAEDVAQAALAPARPPPGPGARPGATRAAGPGGRRPFGADRPALGSAVGAAGTAGPAAGDRGAAVLGRPQRRSGGRRARLQRGHGPQPGVTCAGQAARQRRAGRRGARTGRGMMAPGEPPSQ